MMWGYYDGWNWLWSGMMLLFWAVVIALAIWGVRAFTAPRSDGGPAIATLRSRLGRRRDQPGRVRQDQADPAG